MSDSWFSQMNLTLNSLKENKPDSEILRVAIVGVGNELRGDDAVGLLIIRALRPALTPLPAVLTIEAGQAPENYTGVLRQFSPDLVLMIDAADMGEAAGTVCWLEWQETEGLSATTHTMPLHIIARYLTTELNCQIALIGIQPVRLEFGTGLSVPVKQAGDAVTQSIIELLASGKHTTVDSPALPNPEL